MNPHRKCKNFHITIAGHHIYLVPYFKELFYCFEVASVEHTHIGFQSSELISKASLLEQLALMNNLNQDQIQIDVHKNWGSIWGYHHGFGDKPTCSPAPVWISQTSEDLSRMVLNRRMHRSLNTCEAVAEKTRDLLSKRPIECLAKGMVHLKGFTGFVRDHALAIELLGEDDDVIDPPPKKRHFWYYGPSNTGKSTAAKSHGSYYVVPRNNDWKFYAGQRFIILEEFKGKAPWTIDLLQELADGDGYTVNTKGGSKMLPRDVVLCITSRSSPDVIFANEDPEDQAGVFNRFNLVNLTTVYYT